MASNASAIWCPTRSCTVKRLANSRTRRISFVALSNIIERANKALGSLLGRRGIHIHAEGRKDFGHIALEPLNLLARNAARMQAHGSLILLIVHSFIKGHRFFPSRCTPQR